MVARLTRYKLPPTPSARDDEAREGNGLADHRRLDLRGSQQGVSESGDMRSRKNRTPAGSAPDRFNPPRFRLSDTWSSGVTSAPSGETQGNGASSVDSDTRVFGDCSCMQTRPLERGWCN